ncbi:MAG: pyridoxamine kinase [Clostridiales bacterium]|nr:pyridoxamine kinase [Clostridiales bacterium]
MRVLAINDISCVGKCSLTVSLPVISACGITCDVLPTALLSTHTGGFDGYTFLDLTSEFSGVLHHWKTLGLKFDCIYSGYLGSKAQIDLVCKIKEEFLTEKGLLVVDPVMGDSGMLYKGFDDEYVDKMRTLCRQADYILPNLTEASYLANIPYPATDTKTLLFALAKLCPRPIVTGILEENAISVCYLDEKGEEKRYSSQNVAGFFHGAGDVFSSAFVGAIMKGKTEEKAIQLATDFTTASIRRTAKEVPDKRYGLNFEAEIFEFLKNLNS